MKHITDYLNESKSFSARDFERIEYVYFSVQRGYNGDYIAGTTFENVYELISENYDDDSISYDGYDSLEDVIKALKKMKAGDKLIFTGNNDDWDFVEMVSCLK